MQNSFGLKDFVLFVLLIAAIVSVWISMVQDDKQHDLLSGIAADLRQQEQALALLQRQLDDSRTEDLLEEISAKLDAGVIVSDRSTGGDSGQAPAPRGRFAWARPESEAPVVGFDDPWDFETSPYDDPNVEIGGEFVEIYEGQPPKITPYLYADVYGRRIGDLVCESLGWYNPESLAMEGRLAEAWQYDPGGMWLRVKIHDDARFSNGDPVTAEDVRWTHDDLLYNPEIEAERMRGVYNAIADIEVLSEKVLEFTFKEPRFDNLEQAFGFKVLPKNVYEPWIESPTRFNQSTGLCVGSGPFKLARVDPDDQWTPPSDIVLVRNELYWGPRPALAGFRVKVVQESLARLTAYENGEGDMMRASPEQFVLKSEQEDFLKKHVPHDWFNMRGGYSFIAWQCGPRNGERLTPFHDHRVRMAMTLLTDRERIKRDIFKNLYKMATSPFLSSTEQSDPNIKPWAHDPARAKELLAEAGWIDRDDDGILENERGDEFEFAITFGQGSESTLNMVTFLKQEYAAAGIRMELNPIDWSALDAILKARDFDAVTFAWSASAPENDPNQIWHSKSIENQGDNFIQWNSPEADALIEKGRRVIDEDERMKVWHELHALYHEEQPYTFMLEVPWLRFVTKRVGNFQEYRSGLEYHEFWISRESSPQLD